jgi:CBS domain-containing protein
MVCRPGESSISGACRFSIVHEAKAVIVADVMTRAVISIAPEATVEAAAQMMLDRRISGLFVVDTAGDLVGVITEGDLLHRDELGTERHRPWWLRLFISPAQQAADFSHAHGRRVRDVMTTEVISVGHDETLETVVALMEENHIKRVPVTRADRVVGVVSRSDLMRALIGRARHAVPTQASDSEIRTAILDALEQQSWAPTTTLNVVVNQGVVDLWGTITSESERGAIRVVAENAEGVREVHDHLVYVEPYTGTVIEAPGDRP